MGDRAYAKIVHGFSIGPDEIEDSYEMTERWETEVTTRAGIVPPDDSEWGQEWTDEQMAAMDDFIERRRAAVESAARPVTWGLIEDGEPMHFGIVIAEADWDAALELVDLRVPDDAAKRIADACEFFGIEMGEPKTYLLASYG